MPVNTAKGVIKLTEDDLHKIHNALHSGIDNCVVVQGDMYVIDIHSNGCKYIKIGDWTVMEQNKNKLSKYAERARGGEKLSWMYRGNRWILITDWSVIV
jgi:hypothetical protein